MNTFGGPLKSFRKRAAQRLENEQIAQRWRDGFNAFQKGKDFYFKKRIPEALDCFDEAIDCGYVDDADVYGMRGGCLQTLKFDLDAIDDFDKAIALEPANCVTYFQRSLSEGATGDQHGRVSDLQEAIRRARVDNAYTRSDDAYVRELGFGSCAEYYEMQLGLAKLDLKFLEENSNLAVSSNSYYQEYFKEKANMRRRPNIKRPGE